MLNLLLAVLSAVLLIFSFPRFNYTALMAVALTPLLVAAGRENRAWRRFLLGWVTGAGCLVGICPWIRFVMVTHGGLDAASGWAVFALFCLSKGLYFGVFAWLAGYVLKLWWAIPAVAAAWVAVDATFGAMGFVWITLGHAGVDMGLPMRLAPITGVHGLSFVFMMMATALAQVALRRPRIELAWLIALPLLAALPPLPEPEKGRSQAVLVQPNISETSQWTWEWLDRVQRRLMSLTMNEALRAGTPKPDLLVWPEMPLPLYFDEDPRLRDHVRTLTRVTGTPLLFGAVAHTPDRKPLNSAYLVSSADEVVARYDKVHLVPFGEYVPWALSFANKISTELGDFVPGEKLVVAPANGHKVSLFICYESAFASHVRGFVADGAELLVNLSNDGYFGDSNAREQHLMVVRMRAAENRRWILRGTNSGITASVDPAGRVVDWAPPFVETTKRAQFSYSRQLTFYTRHGDWFAWLCGLVSLAGLGTGWRRHPWRMIRTSPS